MLAYSKGSNMIILDLSDAGRLTSERNLKSVFIELADNQKTEVLVVGDNKTTDDPQYCRKNSKKNLSGG